MLSRRALRSLLAVAAPSVRRAALAPRASAVRSLSSAATPRFSAVTLARRSFSAAPEVTVVVPSMGDSISEGTVMSWLKKPGDAVKEDDVLVQLETDKITVDVRAPTAGVLVASLANPGEAVKVGAQIAKIATGANASAAAASAPKPAAPAPAAEKPKAEAKPAAAPAAPAAEKPKAAPAAPAPAPVLGAVGEAERRVAMTRMRRRIAERLKDAQNTYALLTTFNEVDMSALINMRKEYGDVFEKKHGVKLGFMSPFVRAATSALQTQPVVNAVIDGTDIVYRDYVDISVAVATPTGLVVPVVRNCQEMGFADIEKEIARLGEKARTGSLAMEDMQGGTFTISNGGVFGSLFGTPIVNPPQSAILGMHATKMRPVAVGDKVEVRPMMYLALTYDHRLIDGREAVTFLKQIKEQIEDPRRLILDL